MNKKFSTLMASVLLASAFTVSAQTPVEGDYVRLTAGDKVVGIKGGALEAQTAVTPAAPAADKTYKDVFESVNIQLWKVAKITKSDKTGEKTYQFVNKQTGEYLAIDLVTNQKSHESSSQAKLNGAGNREWAFDDGVLYAYDAKTDSTFFLDSQLRLVSKPGKNTTGGQAIDLTLKPDLSLTLEADAYNALMALPGHSGKLHFNNSKNVSSNEENIVEGVEWTAQNLGSKVFALTDKSSVKGYADNMEKKDNAYVKVDKLNYLQVDTLFHNEQDKYLKLVKDTIPYELKWDKTNEKYVQNSSGYKKPAARRNASNAEFKGEYYFANDSIVLTAVNRPVKLMDIYAAGGGLTKWDSYGDDYDDALAAAVEDALVNRNLAEALAALDEAYETFIATQNYAGTEADKSFNTDYAAEIDKAEALNVNNIAAVTSYIEALKGVKIAKAEVKSNGSYTGAAEDYETKKSSALDVNHDAFRAAVRLLDAAYTSFNTRFGSETGKEGDLLFENAYFKADGQFTETPVEDGKTGKELKDAVSDIASGFSKENNRQIGQAYVAALANVKYTGAVIAKTNINSTGSAKLTDNTLQPKAEEAVTHATLLDNLESLNEAYAAFAKQNTPAPGQDNLKFNSGENATLLSNTEAVAESLKDVSDYLTTLKNVEIKAATNASQFSKYFADGKRAAESEEKAGQLILRKLGNGMVLTITRDGDELTKDALTTAGYTLPLIQPYATSGGDAADIVTAAKVYNLQKKDASSLRATSNTNKYLVAVKGGAPVYVDEVDASNVYAQWAFIPGVSGYYSIQNRATRDVLYTGPVYKVKDADGDVVADTYVLGSDTLKIAGVTLNEDNFYTESKKQYDYSGAYYAGPGEGTSVYKTFAINPVSPFMSQLAAQFDKDSVLVLGDATEAPVWYMEKASAQTYGLEIDGLPRLKKQLYRIYTLNDDEKKLYVYATTDASPVYAVTLLGSKHVYLDEDDAVRGAAEFEFRNMAENQYQFISSELHDGQKMTINATPSKPILEVSKLTAERNDLFMINKSENSIYRTLAEDLINGNVKIYMENEPNRYLYENTANIVANNGNKIAKDSLNFLGIYNTAALTKNAAIYVDTAYVNRKDNYMPQYMFALGVEDVEAQDAIACTYEHNHFDNAGNKVDAEHCSHATPATIGYKAGRYLVSLTDSIDGVSKHPGRYDGETRLAFVNAIHRNAEDALIIKDSKYTGTKNASNDTLKIADTKLNAATFALKIADQSTQSFYMETKAAGKTQWIRILNGVPVLTTKIEDAAIFNIEATDEEATANEAIEAAGVQVIGGKGAVTVQGAAGKVITVANVLGQTIANQVAASDNVTIAAPAGIVVVAVEGEATKVVVK